MPLRKDFKKPRGRQPDDEKEHLIENPCCNHYNRNTKRHRSAIIIWRVWNKFNFLLRLCMLSAVYVRAATGYPNREEWCPHPSRSPDRSREHTKKRICQSSKCIRKFILASRCWVKYQLSVSWITILRTLTSSLRTSSVIMLRQKHCPMRASNKLPYPHSFFR